MKIRNEKMINYLWSFKKIYSDAMILNFDLESDKNTRTTVLL